MSVRKSKGNVLSSNAAALLADGTVIPKLPMSTYIRVKTFGLKDRNGCPNGCESEKKEPNISH